MMATVGATTTSDAATIVTAPRIAARSGGVDSCSRLSRYCTATEAANAAHRTTMVTGAVVGLLMTATPERSPNPIWLRRDAVKGFIAKKAIALTAVKVAQAGSGRNSTIQCRSNGNEPTAQ